MYYAYKALLLSLFFLLVSSSPVFAQKEKAAEEAMRKWLVLIDTGKFKESWDMASAEFKKRVQPEQWAAGLKQAQSISNIPANTEAKSRDVIASQYQEEIPGVPRGEYVIFQFRTQFPNSQVIETVTARFEGGEWKAIGYFVKPS